MDLITPKFIIKQGDLLGGASLEIHVVCTRFDTLARIFQGRSKGNRIESSFSEVVDFIGNPLYFNRIGVIKNDRLGCRVRVPVPNLCPLYVRPNNIIWIYDYLLCQLQE